MAAARSRHLLLAFCASPVIVAGATHYGLNFLEARYPNSTTTSSALRTPRSPFTQHCAYTEVYSARVPVKTLFARAKRHSDATTIQSSKTLNTTLCTTWAQTVLGSRILRTESSLIGLLTRGKYDPGDVGNTGTGFTPDADTGAARELLNGVLVVERPPSDQEPYGLLVSWKLSDDLR